MKKKALRKDFYIEIVKTRGRFISIFFIVALGVAFFTGIRSTQPDMKLSADQTYNKSNLMDIQIISTLGLTADDIEAISRVTGVKECVGTYSKDALVTEDDEQYVVKLLSYESSINQPVIKEGRIPENDKECFVDTHFLTSSGHKIGDKIYIESGTNDDILETLKYKEYTIVGSGSSPYYLSRDKGTSSIGNGNINSFIILSKDAFESEAYTEIYATINNEKESIAFSDSYDDTVDQVIDRIEKEIKAERIEARYLEITAEAKEELKDAKAEFQDEKGNAERELLKAKKKLDDAKIDIENGKSEIKKQEKEIAKGWQDIEASSVKLEDGKKQLSDGKKKLDASKKELEKGKIAYNQGLKEYNAAILDLNQGKAQVKQIEEQLAYMENPEEKAMIETALETQKQEIAKAELILEKTKVQLDKSKLDLSNGEKELNRATLEYNKSNLELSNNERKLHDGKKKLESGEKEILKAKQDLAKGEKDYKSGLDEYNQKKEKADKELGDAEKDLSDAESDIVKIKKPKWYVLDRNSIPSYASYGQDADRIGAIGEVFPAIFFLVAALVSLTTMTRMVEEQRTQIGTLKALGYSKFSIASKYIMYALLATLGGSILGGIAGSLILPYVIISAYQIMYENLSTITTPLNMEIMIWATLIAVVCVVMATFLACFKELAATPANLMRPSAPKLGKRVFLERIPFLWKRLNFTEKSTIRNLIRYKKRFFMTILGIGACMALLLVGYGIKDSIFSITNIQYNEIHVYDGIITLDTAAKNKELEEAKNYIEHNDYIQSSAMIHESIIEAESGSESKDVYLTVLENTVPVDDFYHFRNRVTKEVYSLNDDGVIITEKLSKLLKLDVGDTLILKNGDFDPVEVTIGAVSENYVMHYIFMTNNLYEELYNESPEYNEILYIAPDIEPDMEEDFTEDILTNEAIVSNIFARNISTDFEDTLDNLDVVILVLIFAAGGLAFVVLYNLNNINISERKRELATLKVLGFYDIEVSEYVFRENVLLTIIGTLTGILLGILLHQYVIKTVEIDMIMFGRNILLFSYIKSILLTFLFSIIINFSMHFKLKKVDMATSLKSVE
ncbi:putative ABC transport system permease protein [Mobilisporobacter senegalensis]|uniref:Putative ABC transport system permease protein n=1 Tax=Mobilisporobacter senegalensis TaxID=1329262 RepID=A0A3N1XW48_9FIRM|nr:ABC transporter permease [Mobilisporobacter senegalensis]ROR30431.1 putative ABC transport system permease protein [Mobilisporobacter senegalensis]